MRVPKTWLSQTDVILSAKILRLNVIIIREQHMEIKTEGDELPFFVIFFRGNHYETGFAGGSSQVWRPMQDEWASKKGTDTSKNTRYRSASVWASATQCNHWLSHIRCYSYMESRYHAIVCSLSNLAGAGDMEAKGLLLQLAKPEFILAILFLNDIFQKEEALVLFLHKKAWLLLAWKTCQR